MKNSDICLSIRSIKKVEAGQAGSLEYALELIDDLRPTRLEWSYTWKDEEVVGKLKERVPLFVAALNTISPPGHATSFEGDPIVAPWMKAFGTPETRPTYMCQNNPEDVASRIEQARQIVKNEIADTFQHDDWYCNAQMIGFGNPCFCEHCMREFAVHLGFDLGFDYRMYLRCRGLVHTQELLAMVRRNEVPLWDDYRRFQQQTVSRYFRKLRTAMDRFLGRETALSVNGSVCDFGGRLETVLPFITYAHGETHDFSPSNLKRLATASRKLGVRQVVSFFPDVDAEHYHSKAFIGRVKQAIGICYCLGLHPLFPYDVYAGDKPRWFGTWEEYRDPYTVVRERPDWFDGYQWRRLRQQEGRVSIRSAPVEGNGPHLEHVLQHDGQWETTEVPGS